MKDAKKILSLVLCLILCTALFAGCGGGKDETTDEPEEPKVTVNVEDKNPTISGSDVEHTEDTVYKKDLVAIIGAEVAMISPLNSASSNSQTGLIGQMIWDPLVERMIDGTYGPALATEWSTEDHQTYTFKLREGVVFHNGNPFTAEDVGYTIDAHKNTPGALAATQWLEVDTWEIVNDYEIKVTLGRVFMDFINYVANPLTGILDKESCEADPEHGPEIGTGPWVLSDFLANDHISYVKNENYWGEPALAETFTMKWVAEETARYIMLENDEVDFCGIGSAYVPTYENDERFVINSYVMNNTNIIAFNMAEPLCQDKNFRLAVAHAFDRQACTDITLQGHANTWDSATLWGSRTAYRVPAEELPVLPYDLDLAKEYLAKTSYNGEELKAICAMAHPISNAQVFQEQMSLIGINIDIFDTDGATMAANTKAGYTGIHFCVTSSVWGTLASSVNNYVKYGTNANKANYKNDYIVELTNKADMTPDGEERAAIYREIQEILAEDMPYLGIFNMQLFVGCQKGAGGIVLWPDNHHDYSHAFRVIEE